MLINGKKVQFVPAVHQRPRHAGCKPLYIILHGTEGRFNGAVRTLEGKSDPNKMVSAHFVVSQKGEIVSMVDSTQCAFHAGAALWEGHQNINDLSIGIEQENVSKLHEPWPDAQLESTAAICKILCNKWHIPMDAQHILSHAAVAWKRGRKKDPVNFPFDRFFAILKK